MTPRFAVFPTALGHCGIAWRGDGSDGVIGSQLPAADVVTLRQLMQRRFEGVAAAEPPAPVCEAIALIRRLLAGETADHRELLAVKLDDRAVTAFDRAEGHNPFAPIVPCHRVMGAGGAATGFSAPGGVETKRQLLLIEARAAGQLAGDQQPLF